MAYLMSHFWPDATVEQYKAQIAAVHPADGLPPELAPLWRACSSAMLR